MRSQSVSNTQCSATKDPLLETDHGKPDVHSSKTEDIAIELCQIQSDGNANMQHGSCVFVVWISV